MTRRTLPILLLGLLLLKGQTAQAQSPAELRQWGTELLERIQSTFWMPGRQLYAEEVVPGQKPSMPAFMWTCGVQLSALCAAAHLDSRQYTPLLRQQASGMEVYWASYNGIGGYDVWPTPKNPDRYYDDNGGVGLVMLDAFEVTRRVWYRDRAAQILAFVLSGEDSKNGGGIYWHEQDRKYKAGNISAAAIVLALRLYQRTGKAEYLATARRLYAWCYAHLMDTDGLLRDGVNPDGTVNGGKLPSGAATMLRANCLFYDVLHEDKYLKEAQRIARALEARWIDAKTGAIVDRGTYAHHMAEGFLYLYEQDKNAHWLKLVRRALGVLHAKARAANGFYGEYWHEAPPREAGKVSLIYQACVARAFLIAARYP